MTEKNKSPKKGKSRKAPKKAARKAAPKTAKKAARKTPAKAAAKARAKAPAKAKTKRPAPKKAPPQHWLVRPETIRKLSIGSGVTLAALVAIEAGVQTHTYFGLDGTFAFNAWYGFVACVAMIVAAKGLGAFLKREDTFYGGD